MTAPRSNLFANSLLLLSLGCPSEGDKAPDRESADTMETGEPGLLWFPDADGDGYGDVESEGVLATEAPAGFVSFAGDCDDADASVHPGADELCNNQDDDCDGMWDEDPVDRETWYLDGDGDGYGDSALSETTCDPADGYVVTSGDCDDTNTTIHPGAVETCNEVDDDCDGEVDDNPIEGEIYYPDADGDGYGDLYSSARRCELSEGWLESSEDCDDTRSSIHPGGTERCNRLDDDCDGETDEDEDGDDSVDTLCDLWQDHGLADADVKIIGDDAYDNLGSAVAFAGDLDGDGDDELALGAEEADVGGTASGAVYIVDGPPDASGEVSELAIAMLVGASAGAEAGNSLSRGGDVDLDGYEDVWVNSPSEASGLAYGGSATLMLGPLSGTLYLSEPDLRWFGGEDAYGVRAVDGQGDYDGDGVSDAVVGASFADSGIGLYSGKAWIAPFDGTWGTRDLADAAITLLAEHTRDRMGNHVAFAGDTTGDGTDDVLVSGGGEESEDLAGVVWVISDPHEAGSFTIGDLASERLVGEAANNGFGQGICGLGDMNGDGYDDFAVDATGVSTVAYGAGAVYVFHGPADGRNSAADADATLTASVVMGMVEEVRAGDVNGDGTPDLLAGASGIGERSELAGTAWLVPGPVEEGTSALDDVGMAFEGELALDEASFALDLNGDTNDDGYAEVLIAAPRYHSYTVSEDEKWGAVYMYFGQP